MTLGNPHALCLVCVENVVVLVLSFFLFHKYSTGCTHSIFRFRFRISIFRFRTFKSDLKAPISQGWGVCVEEE